MFEIWVFKIYVSNEITYIYVYIYLYIHIYIYIYIYIYNAVSVGNDVYMVYTYIFISCLVLILTFDRLTTFKKIDTYFMFDVSSVMYFIFDVNDDVTMATATALTITLWTRVLSLAALTNSSISGPRFLDIKLTIYQYRKSHLGSPQWDFLYW